MTIRTTKSKASELRSLSLVLAALLTAFAVLWAGSGSSAAQDTAPPNDRERYAYSPVGFVADETLRISVASLQPPPVADQPPPVPDRVRIVLVGPGGQRLADSGERALEPGQTLSYDLAREQLPPGPSRTGRLQVRPMVVITSGEEGLPPGPTRTSAELVNSGGRTTVYIPPPVHDTPPPVHDQPPPVGD